MAELDENVITRFQGLEDLFQAPLAAEGIERETTFGVIGDGDAGLEEQRQNLPPAGVGFVGLFGDGGVAREEDGHRGVIPGNLQGAQSWR